MKPVRSPVIPDQGLLNSFACCCIGSCGVSRKSLQSGTGCFSHFSVPLPQVPSNVHRNITKSSQTCVPYEFEVVVFSLAAEGEENSGRK